MSNLNAILRNVNARCSMLHHATASRFFPKESCCMLLLFHAVSQFYRKVMGEWLPMTAPLIKQQQQPVQICTVYSNRYSLDIIDSLARLSLRQLSGALLSSNGEEQVTCISCWNMFKANALLLNNGGEHVTYISWWMLVTVVSQKTVINNSYSNWLNHVKT